MEYVDQHTFKIHWSLMSTGTPWQMFALAGPECQGLGLGHCSPEGVGTEHRHGPLSQGRGSGDGDGVDI